MYELSRVTLINESMGFPMFQCFPIKCSFIPSFIPLDIGIMASHISGANSSALRDARQNVAGFWHEVFMTERPAFKQGDKEFTGWLQADGVSLCISRTKTGKRLNPVRGNAKGENPQPTVGKEQIEISQSYPRTNSGKSANAFSSIPTDGICL
jgi:hypothetical protein